MKKAVQRDNIRNIKLSSHSGKIPHSQSPPHKKLLKKIEGIQKNATDSKNNFSLEDKLLNVEQQEEAQDFRVEIERRYKKAITNKEFRFPLHIQRSSDSELQADSSDASLDSLKYVIAYDLASQNRPKKEIPNLHKFAYLSTDRARTLQSNQEEPTEASSTTNFIDFDNDDSDDAPLETKIRDKSSGTYKKLIKLLESNSMFSHNSTNPKPESNVKSQTQQKSQKVQTKYQNFQLQEDAENHHNFLIPAPRGQEELKKSYYTAGFQETEQTFEANSREQSSKYKEKQSNTDSAHPNSRPNAISSRQINSREGQKNIKLLESSSPRKNDPSQKSCSQDRNTVGSYKLSITESNLKKAVSYDKTSILKANKASIVEKDSTNYSTNSASGIKTAFVDTNKLRQESIKKVYSNNVLRSITPQNQNVKQQNNQFFARDGIFKSYNNEGYRAEIALATSVTLAESNSCAGGLTVKSPLSSLYQKAQKEVLSNKTARVQAGNEQNRGATPLGGSSMRKQTTGSKQTTQSNLNLLSNSGKRDETPKATYHKVTLNNQYNSNTYASPEKPVEKYSAVNFSSTVNKLSNKDSSTRALNVISPAKKTTPNEKAIYTLYDATQSAGLKIAPFKLDIGKNAQQQSIDTLSSTRIRSNIRERPTEDPAKQIVSRTVMEQNPSYIALNSSTCKSSSKKNIRQLIPTNKLR